MIIKLFEEYSDGYYTEIDGYEYLNAVKLPFSQRDISLIKTISPYIKPFGDSLMCGVLYSPLLLRHLPPGRKEICIKSLEDDWYLVQIHSVEYISKINYYKCDQIEGIKELLKDKGIL